MDKSIAEFQTEFKRWLMVLDKYHRFRFDKNWQQYTALSNTKGTESKISDPIAPELVERVIQKLFERQPVFYSYARGKQIPKQITDIISAIPSYYWDCPERIQSTGTMRSKLKMVGREFCVTGNVGTEVFYNSDSETPDFRNIPIEDIIFDPTGPLKESSRYYIKQYVSKKYVEDMMDEEDGGWNKTVVNRVLNKYKEAKPSLRTDPTSAKINRSGDSVYEDVVNDLELITLWEGKHCTRFLDWEGIVQEYDNDILDEDPLDFAMDIEKPKQPYATSLLDHISGLTKAKDMIINQIIDYVAKVLNPPLFADPNLGPLSKRSLANAWRLGGIVLATPQQADHKPMPPLSPVSFDLMNYIQQRAESVSGIGAYLGGVPNQVSDKTQGTASGIQSMIAMASSPVKDRQIALEEAIIEPIVNKWLKYAGKLMGDNEYKYILITGQSQKWVKVTKGLLTGKIKLDDLIQAEIMDMEEAASVASQMIAEGKDPLKEIIFDVDWIVRVEAGSMAEMDKKQDLENFDSTIQMGMTLQQPLDLKKVWIERAQRSGIKDPETYLTATPPGMSGMPQNGGINGVAGTVSTGQGTGTPNQPPIGTGQSAVVSSMAG